MFSPSFLSFLCPSVAESAAISATSSTGPAMIVSLGFRNFEPKIRAFDRNQRNTDAGDQKSSKMWRSDLDSPSIETPASFSVNSRLMLPNPSRIKTNLIKYERRDSKSVVFKKILRKIGEKSSRLAGEMKRTRENSESYSREARERL